jgi:hypothetical protein
MDRAEAALAWARVVEAGHTATFEQLPRLIGEHAEAVGLHDTAVFVVDIRETVLRHVVTGATPSTAWTCSRSRGAPSRRAGDDAGGWR